MELIQNNAARGISYTVDGDGYPSLDALKSGPWYYMGDVTTPNKNDYAVVKSDVTHSGNDVRYNFDGITWIFFQEFKQGGSGTLELTGAQKLAINSGITTDLVNKINTNETSIKNEATTRASKNSELTEAISNEATARKEADNNILAKLSIEETARSDGDLKLKEDLLNTEKALNLTDDALKKLINDNKLDIEAKIGSLSTLNTEVATSVIDGINNLHDELHNTRVSKEGDTMTGKLKIVLPGSGDLIHIEANKKGVTFSMDGSTGFMNVIPVSNQTLGFEFSATTFKARNKDVTSNLGDDQDKWTNVYAVNLNGKVVDNILETDDTADETVDTKNYSAKKIITEIESRNTTKTVTETEYNELVTNGKLKDNVIYMITKDEVDSTTKSELYKEFIDIVYPVGSIYISITDAFDPNNQFGGTWKKVESGRYLRAADSGAGSEVDETLPNIRGTFTSSGYNNLGNSGAFSQTGYTGDILTITSTGSYKVNVSRQFNATDSNPIYQDNAKITPSSIDVIMWKRIA